MRGINKIAKSTSRRFWNRFYFSDTCKQNGTFIKIQHLWFYVLAIWCKLNCWIVKLSTVVKKEFTVTMLMYFLFFWRITRKKSYKCWGTPSLWYSGTLKRKKTYYSIKFNFRSWCKNAAEIFQTSCISGPRQLKSLYPQRKSQINQSF